MNGLIAIALPVALLALPATAPGDAMLAPPPGEAAAGTQPDGAGGALGFEEFRTIPVQDQVRIERRVIIRVAPRQPLAPQGFVGDLPRDEMPRQFEERRMSECVPVKAIAGVQVDKGNRLILFMRDRRVVGASLESSCRARDFYSGFYVERNEDGMLCARRDRLQSRSGASCDVRHLRRLVPVKD